MTMGAHALDGIVLAITIHGEHGVLAHLEEATSRAVQKRLSVLSAEDRTARRTAIRALAARLAPAPQPDAPLSPRGRALLAPFVDRPTGAAWLEGAPVARRGFAPEAGLSALLARLAATTKESTKERELAELAEAGCLG